MAVKKKVSKVNNTKKRKVKNKNQRSLKEQKKPVLFAAIYEGYGQVKNYVQADIKLQKETYWMDGKDIVDGFYFYVKEPFSKAYQYHAVLSLDKAEKVLQTVQRGIEIKKGVDIRIRSGMGYEEIAIHKDALPKAETQLKELLVLKREQERLFPNII